MNAKLFGKTLPALRPAATLWPLAVLLATGAARAQPAGAPQSEPVPAEAIGVDRIVENIVFRSTAYATSTAT